jgi:hypothetical protein
MPIKEIGKPAGVNCKHQVGGEVETEEAHKARGKRLGL